MKLFYREIGEGKPFVVLHGLFGLSDNWNTFDFGIVVTNAGTGVSVLFGFLIVF